MRIGDWNLEEDVLIVAEIGNNHEGRVDVARQLIDRAAECGVGGVKFQTFRTRYFVSVTDRARYDRLAAMELSPADFEALQRHAKSLGLLFISTPLDLESAAVLEPLVDAFKIASGDNDFWTLIERICCSGRPIIVSSGLGDLAQIQASKAFIEQRWRADGIEQELAVLHCVSSYPAPHDQLNLAAIPLLADTLGCTVGYSDHTLGTEACIAAVALGARIIEKHFTLDRNYSDFHDHQLSADPADMKQLVLAAGRVQQMRGRRVKALQPCEVDVARVARRSIVAATDLSAGHRLEWRDLTWIRPALGIGPGREGEVIGKLLKRSLAFGEPIVPADLE